MAKAKSKQGSKSVPSYNAAVAQCAKTFAPIIAGIIDAAGASVSRSMQAVGAIKLLAATLKGAEYTQAVAELFGNGLKGKEHNAGTLAGSIGKDDAAAVTIRNFLSHCRTVANAWNRTDVREAAEANGIRKARDVAKPKAVNESGEAAPPVTFEAMLSVAIKERGLAAVLAMVESACNADAKTLEASAVHDLRVKLGAKS